MKKTGVLILLAAVMAMIPACGPGTEISPTKDPSRTSFPSPTATPIVQSVCVQVNAGNFLDEISQATQRLLVELGLTIRTPGEVCDAALALDLTIEPVSAYYTGGGYCYTGAKATGSFTYTITGYSPQIFPVERQIGPTTGFITYCPGSGEAPVNEIWPDAVLYSLYLVWDNEVIFAAVEDEDEEMRSQALGWMQTIMRTSEQDAERAMSALLQAVQSDPSPSVRIMALNMLKFIGTEDDRVLPAMIGALGDDDPLVREIAAQEIGNLGEDAVAAVPALIGVLQDVDTGVRFMAAQALGNIGPEAVEAAPFLILLIEDENPGVRGAAIRALGEIGPGAVEAVPALIQVLGAEDDTLHRDAADSLGEITGQDFGEDAAAWQQWWETQK